MTRSSRVWRMAFLCGGILAAGCGDMGSVLSSIDGKREATFWFWAQLQGLEFREIPRIKQKLESSRRFAKAVEIDQLAREYEELAGLHLRLARQLERLDGENVDEDALRYRTRLMEAHKSVAAAVREFGAASKARDFERIRAARPELLKQMRQYVDLWNERKQVMKTLHERYGGDFDAVD